MAVARTLLGTARDTTDSSVSYTLTNSRAIAANEPCVLFLYVHGSTPTDVATVTGGGVTWVKVESRIQTTRQYVFTADGVPVPSGTAITLTMNGFAATGVDAFCYEFTGSNRLTSSWPRATNSAAAGVNNIVATFAAAFRLDSGLVAATERLINDSVTWTGVTEDSDGTHLTPSCVSSAGFTATPTGSTVTATYPATTGARLIAGVEVLAAPIARRSPYPQLLAH